ncbi:MAG: OmpA family protein, partial [Limnohabitans sp.]
MISTRLLQFILILAIALPLSVTAELDIVQSRMLEPYSTPLRWDNIERAPEWLRGTPVALKKDSHLHTIHLTPSDWVEVRVAGNETLRVLGVEQMLVQDNLRILVSNGSGLYLEPTLQIIADHKNWLAHADSNSPTIYRLEHVGNSTEPIEIALFASRHAYLGELAPYRQLIPMPTDEVKLHQSFDASAQRYWQLGSEQAVTLKVTGPRRLALESRMHYPAPESKILQSWRVNAWLDDTLLHSAEMESSVETLQEVLVNKLPTVASRIERLYLDIPAGEHELRLQSSAPLYARLLQQDSTDYSFPAINQPHLPAETVRNNIDPQKAKQTSWLKSTKELQTATKPTAEATDVEHSAVRLAMDNHWREGGLAGTALLNQAALAHPENQALKMRTDAFAGAHTFFRDLLPKDKIEQADMTYRWFRMPRLAELGKEDRNLVIAPQHAQDLLDHLGSGYFITLPTKSTTVAPAEPSQQKSYATEHRNDTVLFKNDSSHISAEEQSKLQLLAKRWHETNGQLLEVHGHTDSNAGVIYNMKLSERRADAVLRALTALGVRATIVNVAGYGKGKPVADNATSV